MNCGEDQYKVINIYSPNDEYERVKFINKANDWIDPDKELILGGDFNCVLNSDKDRKNCSGSRDIGQIDVHRMINHHDLEDIWRRRFPDKAQYSWNRGTKFSRIDYWLVSRSLDSKIDDPEYHPCIFSDHCLVTFKLRTCNNTHGKGLWKMNSTVLTTDIFKKAFTCMWHEWKSYKNDRKSYENHRKSYENHRKTITKTQQIQ